MLGVCGTRTLLRAPRPWWRLLALPVAFVLLQLVMVPVAMGVLTTNRAHAPLGDATPADHGLAYDDVALRTDDGVDLAAWYVPGDNGAAVVLLHGAGSTRSATLDHAEALAGLGYGVLMLDARGHGGSAGTAMDLGWYGNLDVDCAVDWLLARPDVTNERVGVVGLSMGGEEALTAAAADPRIGAVVAEGVGVRVAADAAPEGWLPDLVNRVSTAVTDLLTSADPPVPLREAVAALEPGQQALLIAGAGEGAQAAWYLEVAADGVSVWDVPDAGHTQALDVHPGAWVARVSGLLDAALLGEGRD